MQTYPVHTIEEATPALQHDQALESGDQRWEDFAPARGERTRQHICKKLNRNLPGQFNYLAFLSHRGAGKSTEINRLIHDLQPKYVSIYLKANTEMHSTTIEIEDLMLVLAGMVEQTMRQERQPLEDKLLDDIYHWFSKTIQTTSDNRWHLG